MMKTHMFAISAYKDSPYLESCIRSLLRQTVRSDIIICTSTPNARISRLAEKYEIPLYVREGESAIGADWNFAYRTADARFVTIAHQDDIYHRDYTKYLLKAAERWPDMSLFCTDCVLIRDGRTVRAGASGLIKKILRLPLRIRPLADRTLIKKAALCLGNPVICPSCAYNKEMLGDELFLSSAGFVLDWDNLWKMASGTGRFICEEKSLLAYRMHEDSETERQIRSNGRFAEEEAMFGKIWPKPAAAFLMIFYRMAARAYH